MSWPTRRSPGQGPRGTGTGAGGGFAVSHGSHTASIHTAAFAAACWTARRVRSTLGTYLSSVEASWHVIGRSEAAEACEQLVGDAWYGVLTVSKQPLGM